MDQRPVTPGSVKRARERAEAGGFNQQGFGNATSSGGRPPANRGLGVSNARNGPVISRPTRVPQWPLPSTLKSPSRVADSEQYRSPPGQAPRRPARPSRIPSMVDQARLQEPTPLFVAPVRTADNSWSANGNGPFADAHAAEDAVPVGTISEIPNARETPTTMPRRGNTQPPPVSFRSRPGPPSSFYSHTSFTSPIIEESPQTRSPRSIASSAAMPAAWGAGMRDLTPKYEDAFYEESISDASRDSFHDEYGDQSQLVSADGPKGRKTPEPLDRGRTTFPYPTSASAMDTTTSSAYTMTSSQQTPETTLGATTYNSNGVQRGFAADSNEDVEGFRQGAGSPTPFGPPPVVRRPPKLDIDAVRNAEARGSLTSLPDLIRRATRLASMIERGKRPASRMDDLTEFFYEKNDAAAADRSRALAANRPQSGFSDMLAAFPPPVHTPRGNGPNRASWLLDPRRPMTPPVKQKNGKKARRCCGLPIWAFVLLVLLILCAIVAAIVIPLEFFVFKNLGSRGNKTLTIRDCQKQLSCLNGGTNVLSQNTCSCICTSGFTGVDCNKAGSVGCTTTNLVSPNGASEINDVTLGVAIPRLIAEANTNFSLALSGTAILAKFNTADLSCIAQNSLVTFNGHSTRVDQQTPPKATETGTLQVSHRRNARHSHAAMVGHRHLHLSSPESSDLTNTVLETPEIIKSRVHGRADDSGFVTTEKALDFARAAVLFVLQEGSLDEAQQAQNSLQDFFTKAADQSGQNRPVTNDQATNITIGGNRTANLIAFSLDPGSS